MRGCTSLKVTSSGRRLTSKFAESTDVDGERDLVAVFSFLGLFLPMARVPSVFDPSFPTLNYGVA